MSKDEIEKLLKAVKNGNTSVEQALEGLKSLPFRELDYAKIDTHRELRTGVPEVIFCSGKSISQIQGIVENMALNHKNFMGTRASKEVFEGIKEVTSDCEYYEEARIVVVKPSPVKKTGLIAIVSGGTSDHPVAEEAAVTAEILGNNVERIYDCGVAGIHRLLDSCEPLLKANVAIAIAGMEGALASVVAGLTACPVIGVPTSVGYGANFGGLSALLSMLNSCASGLSVVNIDNGFGAGFQANLINKLANPTS